MNTVTAYETSDGQLFRSYQVAKDHESVVAHTRLLAHVKHYIDGSTTFTKNSELFLVTVEQVVEYMVNHSNALISIMSNIDAPADDESEDF